MSYKKLEKDLEKKIKVVAVNDRPITPTNLYAPQIKPRAEFRQLPKKNTPKLNPVTRGLTTAYSTLSGIGETTLRAGEGFLDATLGNALVLGSKPIDMLTGTNLSKKASDLVKTDWVGKLTSQNEYIQDFRYSNPVTNTVDQVASTLTNAALQYKLGILKMAAAYGGQKMQEKLNEGSTYGKAVASGAGNMAAQVLADKAIGGLVKDKTLANKTFFSPFLSNLLKNGGDDAVKATAKETVKKLFKGAGNTLIISGKEWSEETLENVLDKAIDNAIYGTNENILPSVEEFLQTGKISALTTILLGAGTDYVNRNYANKIKQDIDTIRSSDKYINGDAETKANLDNYIDNMIKDYHDRFNESEIKKDNVNKDEINKQTNKNLGNAISLSSSTEDLIARKNELQDFVDGSKQLLGSVEAFSSKKELATITGKYDKELKSIDAELKKRGVVEQEQALDAELESVSGQINKDLDNGIETNTAEEDAVLNEIMNKASELDKDSKIKFNTNKAKVLQNKKQNFADARKLVNDINDLLDGENYGKVRIATPDTATDKMAVELGSLFGKQVVFLSSPFELKGIKAPNNNDLLFLDKNDKVISTAINQESGEKISVNTNVAYTVLHETFHTMKADADNKLYNDFMTYIKNTTTDEQLTEYVMYRYGKDTQLANQMRKNTDELIEEIGADEFAKLLTDKKTLNKLKVNDESLFKRVINYIKDVIETVSQHYFKSPLTKDQVNSLRKILEANINDIEIDAMKEVEKTLGYNPVEMKKIEDGVAKLEAKEQRQKEKAKLQEEKELRKLERDIKKLEKAEKDSKKPKKYHEDESSYIYKRNELPKNGKKTDTFNTLMKADYTKTLEKQQREEEIKKAREEGYRQGFKDAGGTPQNTREQSANRNKTRFKEVYAEGTFRNLKGKLTEFRDKLDRQGVLNNKDNVRVTELVRQVNESKLDLSDDQINAFIQLSEYVDKSKVNKPKTETTKVNKKGDTIKDIVNPFALNEDVDNTKVSKKGDTIQDIVQPFTVNKETVETTTTTTEPENTPKVETTTTETTEKTTPKKTETKKKEPKKKVVDKVVPKTDVQEVVKAIPKEERPFASDIVVAKVDNPKTVDDLEVVSPNDITVEETTTQVNEEEKLKAKLASTQYELEKSFDNGKQEENIDKYLEYKKLGGKEIPKFENLLNRPKNVESAYSRTVPDSLKEIKLPTKKDVKVEETTKKEVKNDPTKDVNYLKTKVTELEQKIKSNKKLEQSIPTMLNMYNRYLSMGGEKIPQIESYKNTELNTILEESVKSETKKEAPKVEEVPKTPKEDTVKPKPLSKETKTEKLPTKKLEKKTETKLTKTKLTKTQMVSKIRDDLAWYQHNLDENYLTSAIDQYQEYKNAGGKVKIAELDEIIEQRKNDKIDTKVNDNIDDEITGPSDEELRQLEEKLTIRKTPELPKSPTKQTTPSKDEFFAKLRGVGFKFDVGTKEIGTKESGEYLSKVLGNVDENTDPNFRKVVEVVRQLDSKLGMISRKSNEDAVKKAIENLQSKGVDEEFGRLTAQKDGRYINAYSTEDGFELAAMANFYKQHGDIHKARECMAALQETATNSGRFVQSMAAIKMSSPELYAMSLIDQLSKYYKKNVDSNINDPIIKAWISEVEKKGGVENLLSPEEYMVMESLVTEAFKEPDTDSDAYKQRIALAEKIVADKMPKKMGEQLMNARKLSMMLNGKSLVRNVVTPIIGHPVNLAKSSVGSVLDSIVTDMYTYKGEKLGKTMGNITKAERKDIQPFIDKAVERAKLENRLGITTQDGANLEYQRDPFNSDSIIGKVGNRLAKAVYGTLNTSDQYFYARYFEGILQYQMRANNVNEPTAEMIAIATRDANEQTYKNKNSRIYKKSMEIVNLFNKVDINGFRLGDVLAPFILTPSNIASLAVHYSPVGAIDAIQKGKKFKSMLDDGKVSKEDVLIAKHEFVNSMSQATVGSLMFVAATALAKAGLTTGAEDEDKETAEFMKAVGFKPYSFKIGGKYITYNWAQPYTTPMAIMSEYERLRNKDDLEMNIFDEFKQLRKVAADSILQQTALDTIKTFISGDGYGDDDFEDRLWDTVVSLPASFIPGIVKQTADFIDPNQKQVYDENPLKYGINQILNGTPLLKSMLEDKPNVLGDVPQKYTGLSDNPIVRLADAYLNPTNVGSDTSNQYLTKELLDVYNNTGVDSILPTRVKTVISYTVDGKKMDVKLTTSQRNEIIGKTGKNLSNAISELLLNDSYVGLDYAEKAELLKTLGSYARDKAIVDSGYAKGYAPTNGDYATINKYMTKGLSLANALTYKQIINKIEGDKDENGETIKGSKQGNRAYTIMQMDISDSQKNAMLSLITSSKTPETVDSLSNLLTLPQYQSYFAMNKKDTFIIENISRADYVIASSMGIDTDTFLNYANDVSAITADYDANGNAIPNSKRNKIFNYINNLPGLNIAQKAYLLRNAGYSAKQYKGVVYNYINSLPITATEKNEIWQIMYGK